MASVLVRVPSWTCLLGLDAWGAWQVLSAEHHHGAESPFWKKKHRSGFPVWRSVLLWLSHNPPSFRVFLALHPHPGLLARSFASLLPDILVLPRGILLNYTVCPVMRFPVFLNYSARRVFQFSPLLLNSSSMGSCHSTWSLFTLVMFFNLLVFSQFFM